MMAKPCYALEQGDCGIAVLQYILGGSFPVSIEEIRANTGVSANGLTVKQMVELASGYSLRLRPKKISDLSLLRKLSGGWIMLCESEVAGGEGHYVYVVTRVGMLWLVMDPYAGWRLWTSSRLISCSSGILLDVVDSTAATVPRYRQNADNTSALSGEKWKWPLVLNIVAALCSVAAAAGVGWIVDSVLIGDVNNLRSAALKYFALISATHVLAWLADWRSDHFELSVWEKSRDAVLVAISSARPASLRQRNPGQLEARLDDARAWASYSRHLRIMLPTQLMLSAGILIVVSLLLPEYLLLAFVTWISLLLLAIWWAFFAWRSGFILTSTETANTSASIEFLSALPTGLAMSDDQIKQNLRRVVTEKQGRYSRAQLRVAKGDSLVANLMTWLAGVVLCAVALISVGNSGRVEVVANLVMFLYLMGLLTSPITQLASMAYSLAVSRMARERFKETVLHWPTKNLSSSGNSISFRKCFGEKVAVSFDNVQVGFWGGGLAPMYPLTFSAVEGDRVVLTGPSGCGKTSACRVLVGDEGFGGRGDVSVTLNRACDRLIFVDQFPVFASGSVYENVTGSFGEILSDDECRRVVDLLSQVGFSETEIVKLTSFGYVISGSGSNLSAGERARLALARALYSNPSILILDEVTANLPDNVSHEIVTVVNSLPVSIVIWVSHDPIVKIACREVKVGAK